ncbi:MAG: hypothetical protein PVG53_02315 [Holophagae bacterium]|jgi:hypothetical protein
MDRDDDEIAYYRDVEDCFAELRGAAHVLSPRDFQLLRSWWRDGVPMAAVVAGLTEVFARTRERDDADPVSSLSYCRHAVRRHAKRWRDMHVGAGEADTGHDPDRAAIRDLVRELGRRADAAASSRPAVASILRRVADQVERAARELPPALLDEHLFALETTMLDDCWRALGEDERSAIGRRVDEAAAATTTDAEAHRRSVRALRDRETRLALDLPRLEADG